MKVFRDPVVPREQGFLLPPSVNEFVAIDAPVRILSEIIDQMDCSFLYKRYRGGGAPAYDPRMLLKVLVFGYGQGIRSSRRLAQALEHDLRFMFLAEMAKPDFHTLCRFRKENEAAIRSLFAKTVGLAQQLGMALLEHAAIDGTKVQANVARRNVLDAGQIEKRLAAVQEAIDAILAEAEETDASEDAEHGTQRGDEVPQELADKKERKERLQRAKELLAEQGAKTPNLKTVATTDPESRLMKTRVGCRAAYNAQAVVDRDNQIIVAAEVIQQEADNAQLAPMLEQVRHNCGELPQQISADTGYWSMASLEYASNQGVDAYIPAAAKTPRQKTALDGWTYDAITDKFRSDAGEEMYFSGERERDGRKYRSYRKCAGGRKEVWVRTNGLLAEAMRAKLITQEGRAVYKRRQEIVEPVFGHIKACLGLQRLLLRGLQGARIEYLLACAAHNLGKIMRREANLLARA